MKLDIQKWAPWNWFRKEDEEQGHAVTLHRPETSTVPSLYGQHPIYELHREMDRLFDRASQLFGMSAMSSQMPTPDLAQGLLKPSVDIKENDKLYTISVEVPGVDQDNINLELADNALTITGEKRHEGEKKGEKYYCVERSYGSFKRVLSLPQDADEDGIDARFKNGVLEIEVPRKQIQKPETESRVISIHG